LLGWKFGFAGMEIWFCWDARKVSQAPRAIGFMRVCGKVRQASLIRTKRTVSAKRSTHTRKRVGVRAVGGGGDFPSPWTPSPNRTGGTGRRTSRGAIAPLDPPGGRSHDPRSEIDQANMPALPIPYRGGRERNYWGIPSLPPIGQSSSDPPDALVHRVHLPL
jgi:hypothetical protein